MVLDPLSHRSWISRRQHALPCERRNAFGDTGLAARPICRAFSNRFAVREGNDARHGCVTVQHRDLATTAHARQVTRQVVLQVSYLDWMHIAMLAILPILVKIATVSAW